jgi:acyl-CoA synthetase (AMP-forming)/AMP-acid ligase II
LILIILQHTPHLFYSYLGAILAGAIPSFMPFPSPKQRPDLYWADHQTLFDRIKPRLIITYERNLADAQACIADFSIPTLIAGDAILSAPGDHEIEYAGFSALPDDVACLQHSSGTTSLKKGVMLTHRAILDEVAAYSRAIDFGPRDSIASWLPLYHDMGFIACFMTSMLEGTHLVQLDPFEWTVRPHILLEAMQEYRTTFCWLPNFAFSHIVNAAPAQGHWNLSAVRAIIDCSEPCKKDTFERFVRRFGDCGIRLETLQVSYAMAENVFAVTQTSLGRPVRVVTLDGAAFSLGKAVPVRSGQPGISIVSCGRPVDGVEIKVCDERSDTSPDGTIGEITVTGPFLFTGYYKLPEKTRERLRDGWYATGDMGFLLDGELFVTGRIDDMLIVNGRNYYAHEIEAIVNTVPSLLPGRNVAIGVDDARSDATSVVVLAECAAECDAELAGREVRRMVLERLGLAIHSLVTLPAGELVKTTSGKISRVKNKQLFLKQSFGSAGHSNGN